MQFERASLEIVGPVAVLRMDSRLAHKLLQLSRGEDQVASTQQQLASELGTAREVVSRMLAEFQRRDWLSSTRGHITIVFHSSHPDLLAPQHEPPVYHASCKPALRPQEPTARGAILTMTPLI